MFKSAGLRVPKLLNLFSGDDILFHIYEATRHLLRNTFIIFHLTRFFSFVDTYTYKKIPAS